MTAINVILVCLIMQPGGKGTYPTFLLANYMDDQSYYTVSQSKADSRPVKMPGKKISKKSCKVINSYGKVNKTPDKGEGNE